MYKQTIAWLAQYGRWDFVRDTVGFIASDKVLINFIYLFIYIWSNKTKSAFVQLINYQLFDLLPSLQLKSHIIEPKCHFTPKLLIRALGDLAMCNLAYTSHLLEWTRPAHFGQYEKILLFIFRLVFKVCLCQAIALHPMLHYVHFMLPLHCRNQLNKLLLPLLVAHWVSDLKISGAMTFRPSVESFLNGPLRRVLRWMPNGILPSETQLYINDRRISILTMATCFGCYGTIIRPY
jgi:hypothetical protein